MSNQVAANSTKLYTQTLPVTGVTSTLSGMFSPSILFPYSYFINGPEATVYFVSTLSPATVSTADLVCGTLPAAIRPSRTLVQPATVHLNGSIVPAYVTLNADGTWKFTAPSASAIGQTCGTTAQSITYQLI